MAEIIEAPAPEVIAQPSPAPDAPKRFEIPSFTDKKVDVAAADAPDAPRVESEERSGSTPVAQPGPAPESAVNSARVHTAERVATIEASRLKNPWSLVRKGRTSS